MLTRKGWAWLTCLLASAVVWLGLFLVVKGCNSSILDADAWHYGCDTEWGDVWCIAEVE